MKSQLSILLFLVLTTTGCIIGAGTLGGFDLYFFPTSKSTLVKAIDTLFSQHPEYKIPRKWISLDDWKEKGFDFLDTRIFYFKSTPEEMYYVSFYGDANENVQADTTQTGIAITAVNIGTGCNKESETSSSEKQRIEKRFNNEIISKLEAYTETLARQEE